MSGRNGRIGVDGEPLVPSFVASPCHNVIAFVILALRTIETAFIRPVVHFDENAILMFFVEDLDRIISITYCEPIDRSSFVYILVRVFGHCFAVMRSQSELLSSSLVVAIDGFASFRFRFWYWLVNYDLAGPVALAIWLARPI